MVEELLGTESLICSRGKISPLEATTKTKLIGFLFLNHGCPFTFDITNTLIITYNKVNAESKQLEIIFCHSSHLYNATDEAADHQFA